MDENTFKQQLAALTAKINELPPSEQIKLNDLLQKTCIRRKAIQQNLSRAKSALGDIRLNIKYMIYDMEMTKKECQARADNQNNQNNK